MLKTAALELYDQHYSQHTGLVATEIPFIDNQQLSVLISIDNNSESSQEFIHQLLTLIKDLACELEIKTAAQPLEKLLSELNNKIPKLPKASHFLTQLNCALAWQNQPEVSFTACGKVKIFLIKEASIKEIKLEKNDGQIFQQILQGDLKENDSLLFATYSLVDYISQEKIKKTVSTLPLNSAMAYLENILSKAPQKSCFWALAIKSTEKEVTPSTVAKELPRKVSQQAPSSIDQLLNTKRNTSTILDSPKFSDFAKEQAGALLNKVSARWLPFILKNLQQGSKDYFLIIYRGGRLTFKFFKKRNWPQLRNNYKNFWQETVTGWQSLGRTQKMAIFLIIAILIILTQNIKWQTKFVLINKNNAEWQQIIDRLDVDVAKIEAALIYNDHQQAVSLLAEIEPDLSKTAPLQWQSHFNDVKEKLNNLKAKLWKITTVKENVWQDLNNLKQPFTPVHLKTVSEQRIYLSGQDKQYYLFDSKNGQRSAPKLTENAPLLPELIIGLPKSNTLLGLTNEKKAYTFDDGNFRVINWTTKDLTGPKNLFVYDSRVYVLGANNQIFRYSFSASALANETSWFKTIPNNGVKSFGVDGDLYLLNSQNNLEKYNRGQKITWQADALNQPLDNAQLLVGQATNKLYVFSASQNRLVIYEKNGQLNSQLTNPLFAQTIDWTILEKNKLLLIATKDKIYSFPLPQ